jgi:predicted small secreted protein
MFGEWHHEAVIPAKAGTQPPTCLRDEDEYHELFLGLGSRLRGNDSTHLGAAMKKLSLVLLAMFTLTLAGCNTMQGIGKDVQKAGEKIEDASKKK